MKKLLGIVSIVLLILVIGSVNSLATELSATNENTGAGTVQIGASSNKSTNNTNTNKSTNNTNTNKNTTAIGSNVVGSSKNTNTNKTNTNTNASKYNSTSTNSSSLPYAGTSTTSIVLVAIAFAGSAVYAYKKVSDYNV